VAGRPSRAQAEGAALGDTWPVADDRRARREGLVAGLSLIALIIGADVVEGLDRTAYVGVLTAVPFLVAALARPVDVVGIGVLSLVAGQVYAETAGAGTDPAQVVRLVFIAIATVVAAGVAAVRRRREQQLVELTSIAETAQATILRPIPERVGPVRVAARYRSAASAARVGGDFYDLVETEYGVRLIVGDVRGKGLDAVRLAAAVLGSFREAAHSAGADLKAVAAALDRATGRETDLEDFVTAAILQIDRSGRCVLVNCGHPAPVLVTESGAVVLDPPRHSPPLGLGVEPVAQALTLGPGDRLLLYTDGLSEARDSSRAFFPVEAVAAVMHSGQLSEAADDLLAAVREHAGGRLDDDLAIVLLEHVSAPAVAEDRTDEFAAQVSSY
jgi:sigma-B regulation protein RsbU (phosphoserine phosphatase)